MRTAFIVGVGWLVMSVAGCVANGGNMREENTLPAIRERGVQPDAMMEQDSIRITVRILPDSAQAPPALRVRRMGKRDFEPILGDDYVNYAEDEKAELLRLYNAYQDYAEDQLFDLWGNPLFPPDVPNPLLGVSGRLRYTVMEVKVENRRSGKVKLQPFSEVVVTGRGDQFAVLSKEDLEAEVRPEMRTEFGLMIAPRSWVTPAEYYQRFKAQLNRSLFSVGIIFPGASSSGLLLFPRLNETTKPWVLIFPEVNLFEGGRQTGSPDLHVEIP